MRTLLGNKVIGCFDVEQFLFVESVILYVTSVGLAIIWNGPLRRGCNLLEIPF